MAKILTIKQVAKYLQLPLSTTYKLTQKGELPAVKIGKSWRFHKSQIDELFGIANPHQKPKRKKLTRGRKN